MAIDEKELYETLGLPYQEAEAAKEQEPAAQNPESGAETAAQEPAGEGQREDQQAGNDTTPAEGESRQKGREKPEEGKAPEEQEKERRARAAESRRQAQQRRAVEEALAAERAKEEKRWQEFFATAGLKSPVDGKPITSLAEYQAYQQSMEERRIRQNLQKGQLLPEDIQAIIRKTLAEQQPAETKTQPAELEKTKAPGREVTQSEIQAELEEISKLDPAMVDLETILKSETGKEFEAAVRRGASFIEAFKLANFDRLQQSHSEEAAKRAEQAARNKARSKDHLQTSKTAGTGSVPVPADVKEMYRFLVPDKSDAEIQAHYNRMLQQDKNR